jgi:L-aspartate oxidase
VVARAAAAEADPETAPAPAEPAPDLSDGTLQQLRAAMARDAGVVRDALGLGRLLGEIGALEAAEGLAPTLVAARLIAASALARRESRGAQHRADFPNAAEPPRRTLTSLAEANRIAAQAAVGAAAE